MSCDVGEVTERLENELCSVASPRSQFIFQPLFRFSNPYFASPTFPSLHLRDNSFSSPSVALPTSQLILQPFRHFIYVTTHSPTLPSPYIRHSSFSNPSVASPTSHFILQTFFRFSYVTSSSLNSPGEPIMRCIRLATVVCGCIMNKIPCAKLRMGTSHFIFRREHTRNYVAHKCIHQAERTINQRNVGCETSHPAPMRFCFRFSIHSQSTSR